MRENHIPPAISWSPCDSTMAHQLTATTYMTDSVYAIPLDALSPNLQKVPGLQQAFVSGYVKPIEIQPSLTAVGEFVTTRLDDDTQKVYNYVFGITDSTGVLFCGPFKGFLTHHMNPEAVVPLEQVFGQNPIYFSATGAPKNESAS